MRSRSTVFPAGALTASLLPTLVVLACGFFAPACCCGGAATYPSPGPPGQITGDVVYDPGHEAAPTTVYAIAIPYYGEYRYVASRVEPPITSYAIDVPPGMYFVVARLDTDLAGAAGYTYDIQCSVASQCRRDASLAEVRVDSGRTVAGIDLGDWQGYDSRRIVWNIDAVGSVLPAEPWVTPTPADVPTRAMPPPADMPVTLPMTSRHGFRTMVPAAWKGLGQPPVYDRSDIWGTDDEYIANELVHSPIALGDAGLLFIVQYRPPTVCRGPDWTLTTAKAQLQEGTGSAIFYFERPPAGDAAPQPFRGYRLTGMTSVGSFCFVLTFTTRTEVALDASLPLIAAIVSRATFVKAG